MRKPSNDCPRSGPVLQTWLSHCSQNFIQWTGTSAGHFDCRLRSPSGGRERNYDEVPYKLQSALEQRLRGHLRHRRTDLVQEPKMHHADGRPYPASCSSAQLDSPLLSIRDPGVRWPVGLRNGVASPRCRTLPDRSDELFLLCRGCGPSSFPTEAAGRNSDSPTRGRSFGCPQAADRYGRSFEIQSTEEGSPANHSSTGNLVASRSMRTLRLGPGQQGRRASRVGSRCGG